MVTPMKIEAIFAVMIAIIFFVALIPTIVSQIQDTDNIRLYDGNVTAGQYGWNFTGASGAITIFLLIPFVVIAAFCLGIVLKFLGKGGM